MAVPQFGQAVLVASTFELILTSYSSMRGSVKYRRLLAIGLILGSLQVFAQEKTDTTQVVVAVPDQNEVQDESWSYLGQRPFYQFKKRMNLTTREEWCGGGE